MSSTSFLLKAFLLAGSLLAAPSLARAQGEQVNSPLDKKNLSTILDHRREYSVADVEQLLGPPLSVEAGGAIPAGRVAMRWEDVSRIELTFRDGIVAELKGTFSPHLRSEGINYATFQKLAPGMQQDDVYKHFLGHGERRLRNADGSTTLVFEQYVHFSVTFDDGRVASAGRIEYLNR